MRGAVTAHVCARTDVGNHREHNEDNFLVADLSPPTRRLPDEGHAVGHHGVLLVVCDGMGGAAAGEVASDMAIESLYAEMTTRSAGTDATSRDELAERIEAAAHHANAKIHQDAIDNPERKGMGTTFTAAALVDDHLIFAQVGDSRGYLLRGDELTQVTRDQSLLAKLLESGALKPEQADTFEHGNVILQALGASTTVIVEVTYVDLRRGDRLLLCSDGLSGLVPADEIAGILGAQAEPTRICIELIERAKELGGDDNVTAIVAFFDGEGIGIEPAPVSVRRYGPAPELPAIPDPRNLGKLLEPMVMGAVVTDALDELEEVVEPEVPEAEPVLEPSPEPVRTATPTPAPEVVVLRSARPVAVSGPPAVDAQPVVTVPPSLGPDAAAPRSNKTWLAAAVLVAVALVAGTALYAMSDLRKGRVATANTASTAGVSTWTTVESSGGPPSVGSAAVEAKSASGGAMRPGDPRTDLPPGIAHPFASARPVAPALTASARKGDLAPIRDDTAE